MVDNCRERRPYNKFTGYFGVEREGTCVDSTSRIYGYSIYLLGYSSYLGGDGRQPDPHFRGILSSTEGFQQKLSFISWGQWEPLETQRLNRNRLLPSQNRSLEVFCLQLPLLMCRFASPDYDTYTQWEPYPEAGTANSGTLQGAKLSNYIVRGDYARSS